MLEQESAAGALGRGVAPRDAQLRVGLERVEGEEIASRRLTQEGPQVRRQRAPRERRRRRVHAEEQRVARAHVRLSPRLGARRTRATKRRAPGTLEEGWVGRDRDVERRVRGQIQIEARRGSEPHVAERRGQPKTVHELDGGLLERANVGVNEVRRDPCIEMNTDGLAQPTRNPGELRRSRFVLDRGAPRQAGIDRYACRRRGRSTTEQEARPSAVVGHGRARGSERQCGPPSHS
jgi:hypothetical protein